MRLWGLILLDTLRNLCNSYTYNNLILDNYDTIWYIMAIKQDLDNKIT